MEQDILWKQSGRKVEQSLFELCKTSLFLWISLPLSFQFLLTRFSSGRVLSQAKFPLRPQKFASATSPAMMTNINILTP
jgi:hypothetical protein